MTLPAGERLPQFCPRCGALYLDREPMGRVDHPTASAYDCVCKACTWAGTISPDLAEEQLTEAVAAGRALRMAQSLVQGLSGPSGGAPDAPMLSFLRHAAHFGLLGFDAKPDLSAEESEALLRHLVPLESLGLLERRGALRWRVTPQGYALAHLTDSSADPAPSEARP